jgi:hypothetical protein
MFQDGDLVQFSNIMEGLEYIRKMFLGMCMTCTLYIVVTWQQRAAEAQAEQKREGERTTQIAVTARCISSTCSFARTLLQRPFQRSMCTAPAVATTAAGQLQLLLPSEYLHLPASAIASKLAHTCSNHFKSSLTTCSFHPQSSRVVTGNRTGELALWELTNGFRFVKQFCAHQAAKVYAMEWAHNEQYCITGDSNGYVKCASHATDQIGDGNSPTSPIDAHNTAGVGCYRAG